MRTRIKICGITRIEDAELVANSGADALGMIFHKNSPRNITINQAQNICKTSNLYVTTVAVVVNPAQKMLTRLVSEVGIDRIQYHGDETQQLCEKSLRPWYKALRVTQESDIIRQAPLYSLAHAFLLDTYVKGLPGGTGQQFDWSIINNSRINKPIILAGGLNPDNVYKAVLCVQPYAVDVNSGVEIKPGIKDANKINEFIIAVHEADQALHKTRNESQNCR